MNTKIEELELSVHTYTSLKRASVQDVGGIIRLGITGLKNISNLGNKGLNEIKDKLDELNLQIPTFQYEELVDMREDEIAEYIIRNMPSPKKKVIEIIILEKICSKNEYGMNRMYLDKVKGRNGIGYKITFCFDNRKISAYMNSNKEIVRKSADMKKIKRTEIDIDKLNDRDIPVCFKRNRMFLIRQIADEIIFKGLTESISGNYITSHNAINRTYNMTDEEFGILGKVIDNDRNVIYMDVDSIRNGIIDIGLSTARCREYYNDDDSQDAEEANEYNNRYQNLYMKLNSFFEYYYDHQNKKVIFFSREFDTINNVCSNIQARKLADDIIYDFIDSMPERKILIAIEQEESMKRNSYYDEQSSCDDEAEM